jgi:hypothetical protein
VPHLLSLIWVWGPPVSHGCAVGLGAASLMAARWVWGPPDSWLRGGYHLRDLRKARGTWSCIWSANAALLAVLQLPRSGQGAPWFTRPRRIRLGVPYAAVPSVVTPQRRVHRLLTGLRHQPMASLSLLYDNDRRAWRIFFRRVKCSVTGAGDIADLFCSVLFGHTFTPFSLGTAAAANG